MSLAGQYYQVGWYGEFVVSNLRKEGEQWLVDYVGFVEVLSINGTITGQGAFQGGFDMSAHNASQVNQAGGKAGLTTHPSTTHVGQRNSVTGSVVITNATIVSSLEAGNPLKIWTYPGGTPTYLLNQGQDPQVRLSIKPNNTAFPIIYRVMQNDEVVEEIVRMPGDGGLITNITVPTTDPVTVVALVEGLTRDGPSWVVTDDATVTEIGGVGGEITPEVDPDDTEVPAPNLPEGVDPSEDPPVEGDSEKDRPIWDPNTDAKEGDGLTNATFKQGIDKLAEVFEKQGGGSGGGADMSGVESRLDTANARLQGLLTAVQDTSDTAPDIPQDTDVALDVASSVVSPITSKLPELPEVELPESTGQFSFAFGVPGMDAQEFAIDLSPWETQINVFKLAIRGGLALWFFFMCVRAVREAFAG